MVQENANACFTASFPAAPHTDVNKNLYAKAIYDNIAETPDELAFKRGDLLTVIEQDTDGLEGWWLCTLRGRQGICPGNRLKVISYEPTCYSPSPVSSPCQSLPSIYYNTSILSSTDSILYENSVCGGPHIPVTNQQRHGKRRSWHILPNKVITPQKCGDVYLYDLLPQTPTSLNSPYQNFSIMSDLETYDTPKSSAHGVNYDSPRPWSRSSPLQRFDESYDVPRSVSILSQQMMTPSSSNSSLLTPDSHSISSSNRSSLVNMPDYDIPRRFPTSSRTASILPLASSILSMNALSMYDTPSNAANTKLQTSRELPLELSSALEALAKLETEATGAIIKLLGFVTPQWRTRDNLEPVLMDVKLAIARLKSALHDLAEFGDGAFGNAIKADDKRLAMKLRPLCRALRDADKLVHDVSQNLDVNGWTIDILAKENSKDIKPTDNLNQLIACAQNLTEDVRQIASFIQGNATLLFKRSQHRYDDRSKGNADWPDDYEYISFESKKQVAKTNTDFGMQKHPLKFERTAKGGVANAGTDSATTPTNQKIELNPNDKSLLLYYATQTITHMKYLTQAIDAFLQTVERNQPPKYFLANGKFVVLSAHNLISIGDIVHRNISHVDVKRRLRGYTDSLSDTLKTCVAKTKNAAQHFPSVAAVQEMVDSIVDISHLAYDLKISMLQAANP